MAALRPPTAARSANMRAVRRRDTQPEKRVRKLLHAQGLRYRVDLPIRVGLPRPVRPDVVFPRVRLAVFVDGCFWHGCPDHKGWPKTNTEFWDPKITGNRARDVRQAEALTAAGWKVLRFWEHQPPEDVAHEVAMIYRQRRSQAV